MSRGKANGTGMGANGGPERPSHVAGDLCELR
jgi:hypothetical protein